MGCATSNTNNTNNVDLKPGPKVYPEGKNIPANLISNEETTPATSTVVTEVNNNAIKATTGETTTPSDLEVAAKAQQEETDRLKTADHERQQRVALFRATKDGNVEGVQKVLSEGANVNAKGMWDNTPLICACQYGYREVAAVLLKNPNCDVNAVNEKGCTALHHACIEGLNTIVLLLLEKGAKSNVKPAKLYNSKIDKNEVLDPLQAATVVGDITSIKAIVKNISEMHGETGSEMSETTSGSIVKAITYAISRNVPLAINSLVEFYQSFSSNQLPVEKCTALFTQACKSKNEKTVLSLLNSYKLFCFLDNDKKDLNGDSFISTSNCKVAIECNMPKVLKILLEGNDVGLIDESTLALAQEMNNPDILALLPGNPQ